MKDAIKAVWIFYSALIAAAIFALFLLPGNQLLNKTPVCESISTERGECIACGMTRGFISISELDLTRANNSNKGSVLVFGIFVINTIFFIIHLSAVVNKKAFSFRKGLKWGKPV